MSLLSQTDHTTLRTMGLVLAVLALAVAGLLLAASLIG